MIKITYILFIIYFINLKIKIKYHITTKIKNESIFILYNNCFYNFIFFYYLLDNIYNSFIIKIQFSFQFMYTTNYN